MRERTVWSSSAATRCVLRHALAWLRRTHCCWSLLRCGQETGEIFAIKKFKESEGLYRGRRSSVQRLDVTYGLVALQMTRWCAKRLCARSRSCACYGSPISLASRRLSGERGSCTWCLSTWRRICWKSWRRNQTGCRRTWCGGTSSSYAGLSSGAIGMR